MKYARLSFLSRNGIDNMDSIGDTVINIKLFERRCNNAGNCVITIVLFHHFNTGKVNTLVAY